MNVWLSNLLIGSSFIFLGAVFLAKYFFKFGITAIKTSLAALLMYIGTMLAFGSPDQHETCMLSTAGIGCVIGITIAKPLIMLVVVYLASKFSCWRNHKQEPKNNQMYPPHHQHPKDRP